jgi:uncharacterized spore protein YtfJ
MDVQSILSQSRDAMTVKRVFGDPIERDGVTVVPVANIAGGVGGGGGSSSEEAGEDGEHPVSSGSGGGFGLYATPAGVYVIKGDQVRWEPALNLNRVILGGQIIAIVALLVLRSILKHRAK